jgi:hypothetical protein
MSREVSYLRILLTTRALGSRALSLRNLIMTQGQVGPVKCGLWFGSGFILRARAFAGLTWPGLRAWGMDCRLSPKSRSAWTRALGLCSKSQSLGPTRPGPRLGYCHSENRVSASKLCPETEMVRQCMANVRFYESSAHQI